MEGCTAQIGNRDFDPSRRSRRRSCSSLSPPWQSPGRMVLAAPAAFTRKMQRLAMVAAKMPNGLPRPVGNADGVYGRRATECDSCWSALPRCVVPGTRSLGQTVKTCRQTPRKDPARAAARRPPICTHRAGAVLPDELLQIEAAGFRDEEGAESGEGVGYAASKEGPGESAIFAQASDEQWSQGAE